MDEKRCVTCHLMRPLTEFNVRRAARDGLQARCRACSAQWYERNKDSHKANVLLRNRRVRSEHRRRITDYLLEHPCVDCGEDDVRVLDFDHDDPAQKLHEVTRLAGLTISWGRVALEIAKCSVRCANCHRRRTQEMFGFWRQEVETERAAHRAAQARARLTALLG